MVTRDHEGAHRFDKLGENIGSWERTSYKFDPKVSAEVPVVCGQF